MAEAKKFQDQQNKGIPQKVRNTMRGCCPGIPLIIITLGGFVLFSCGTTPPERIPEKPEKPPVEVPRGPRSSKEVLQDVYQALEKGDFKKALALFKELPEEEQKSRDIQLLQANILISAAQYSEAREVLSTLLSQNASDRDALYSLAMLERATGNTKEEKNRLEQIVKVDPAFAAAYAELGNLAYETKTYKLAETYYDKALSLDPKNGDALVGKGRVRRYYRDYKAAETAFNTAIEAYPTWYNPFLERARLYRETGFLLEAQRDIEVAERLLPNDYWILMDKGNIFLDQGKKQEALAAYERAAFLKPDYFLAYVYIAGIKDEFDDYAGAERAYEKLAQLKPEYYFAFEGLGILRMRDGRWEQARDAFLAAYKQSPSHTNYALLGALCWLRSTNTKGAKEFLATLLPTIPRESIEWYMVRLYHDQSGDTDIAVRIDKQTNLDTKARMLYYLAQYYAIKGNHSLAQKFHLMVREMNRRSIIEWRLNEWALGAYGL
ncbi:MAG TPA: tetratricopeptide repeat protein [Termitinemataceae bacterium]|nr:tetratricopeptide repeat protein [Termitinemataceae bacterium]HOM22259.1 tetratricopeptide repeat protein [Termitinemataceae bacterium]HPP99319.1 tetratricopeptide repeat protein [Termitinemataceae bacterium]